MASPRLLYNEQWGFQPARVARIGPIEEVPIVKRAHKHAAKMANEASDFWSIHAEYWRKRGQIERAQECEAEAEKSKRTGY